MSNHTRTLVPIGTWCYSSPELGYQGYSVDIGLLAEALIYYDTVLVNITNPPEFATLIEWFIRQGQYDALLALINDGVLQFYDYSFITAAVDYQHKISIWNIQDPIQEKPNTFEQRFLYHDSVQSILPPGRKRKHFYSALRGNVIEVKASDFGVAIENARSDHEQPSRKALILQAFVDELYDFRKLGHPPKVEATVIGGGAEKKITWNVSFDELTKLAGSNLHFHGKTPFNAGGISNRLLWSAANLDCDLYLSKPMSVLVGDKLYESGNRVLKTNTVIDSLQHTVEFPDVRSLVNDAKLNLDDVLYIRSKAGKFRQWLQREGERDRDAIIAYHNEVTKDTGLARIGRSTLKVFGILGGAAIGSAFENKVPGVPGAVIGATSVAGMEYLFDLAAKINQDWKPIIFGDWMKTRIEFLLDDLKDKEAFQTRAG